MKLNLKHLLALGGKALIKKFGHQAEQVALDQLDKLTDTGKDAATQVITKAFDGLEKKSK